MLVQVRLGVGRTVMRGRESQDGVSDKISAARARNTEVFRAGLALLLVRSLAERCWEAARGRPSHQRRRLVVAVESAETFEANLFSTNAC